VFAAFYFSTTIVDDSKTYGTIGVTFTLITWFIFMGSVIMLGAVFGAVWERRRTGPSTERHPRATKRPGPDRRRIRPRPGRLNGHGRPGMAQLCVSSLMSNGERAIAVRRNKRVERSLASRRGGTRIQPKQYSPWPCAALLHVDQQVVHQ
jgi:hypothetical protein